VRHKIFAALLGVFLLFMALVSFAKPDMCADGCGNLLEPVFAAAYAVGGPWGCAHPSARARGLDVLGSVSSEGVR
jgi:hypothetical protein